MESESNAVLRDFSIFDVFSFNFPAAGNKKQPTWPQNDYEMVDRTASEKNAIINIPEDQNIDEQLPATKGLAQVEPEEEKNLLPFENGEHYAGS